MRISIVLMLFFCFHFTAAMAEGMAVKILPNLKAEVKSTSIEKINMLSKKQVQAIDFEAFSIAADRIHHIEQVNLSAAAITHYTNDGNFEGLMQQAASLKNLRPYIYQSRLKCLYPKHTFW